MRSFSAVVLVAALGIVATNAQFRFGNSAGFRNNRPRPAQPAQQAQQAPAAQSGGRLPDGCRPFVNYQSGNRNFWVSWRSCPMEFRADQITDLCASGGMRPVSLDSVPLAQEFMNLCGQENQKWFWSGGRINGQTTISWPNGVTQSVSLFRDLFSHTGGSVLYIRVITCRA